MGPTAGVCTRVAGDPVLLATFVEGSGHYTSQLTAVARRVTQAVARWNAAPNDPRYSVCLADPGPDIDHLAGSWQSTDAFILDVARGLQRAGAGGGVLGALGLSIDADKLHELADRLGLPGTALYLRDMTRAEGATPNVVDVLDVRLALASDIIGVLDGEGAVTDRALAGENGLATAVQGATKMAGEAGFDASWLSATEALAERANELTGGIAAAGWLSKNLFGDQDLGPFALHEALREDPAVLDQAKQALSQARSDVTGALQSEPAVASEASSAEVAKATAEQLSSPGEQGADLARSVVDSAGGDAAGGGESFIESLGGDAEAVGGALESAGEAVAPYIP